MSSSLFVSLKCRPTFLHSNEMCKWKRMMQTFKVDVGPQLQLQTKHIPFNVLLTP